MKMTTQQHLAVMHGDGPLMVLAGPGSGKTFVITHRIAYLIHSHHVPAHQILVVTFSKAAAMEMEERFKQLSDETPSRNVTFGTFHSVFFSIIRRAYGYHGSQVATQEDKERLMQGIILELGLNTEDRLGLSSDLLDEISLVKEERIPLEHYYAISCSSDIFKEVYKRYEDGLAKLHKIDFDDMLLMTYELLVQREDIRQSLEQQYRYILVDEFQDINPLQYEILKRIAGKDANLTIVGDDDQSIYRFRGAKPEIMLNFPKDFPTVKQVVLDVNFRSTTEIVYASLKLIRHNVHRFQKDVHSHRGDGKKVSIYKFQSRITENKAIIEDIKEYIRIGVNIDEIAILYRMNNQPGILTEMLMEHQIPFVIKDMLSNIYEHWIAKDVIAYFHLATGTGRRADLIRIINKPLRYIKREALSKRGAGIKDLLEYYKNKPYMKETILEMKHCIHTLSTLKPATAIRFLRGAIGYDEYLRSYAKERDLDEEELFNVLGELEHSAGNFTNVADWFSHMADYKQNLEEQYKNQKGKREEEAQGIRLMTFHASKGLEYRIVYILDANEGITPHRKAKSKEELEEERRMFYVAMTRAKDKLNICSTGLDFHKKMEVSGFVKELIQNDTNQFQYQKE